MKENNKSKMLWLFFIRQESKFVS